jgi:cytochrome c
MWKPLPRINWYNNCLNLSDKRIIIFQSERKTTVMKRIGIWMISAVCIAALNTAMADEGETIFKSQGCISCHKNESTSKIYPSLTEISQAYQDKEAQLIKYLKGESEAIVRPEKADLMKRQIEKTKKLSEADLKALADYLLHQQ